MILLYRFFLWLALPILFIVTALHSIKHRSQHYLLQRFGMQLPIRTDKPLWIHAASVGELHIALNLAAAWHQQYPQQAILISTATATSGKVCKEKAPDYVKHCYLPLDYPLLCERFLKRIQPTKVLIIETEIWLNLYRLCARYDIPPIIVNARLSNRTLRYPFLSRYYQQSIQLTRAILACSDHDRMAYISLGANREKTKTIGNLKYASQVTSNPLPNRINQAYILAASTHHNEEQLIAQAWKDAETAEILLVIAPRHIERSKKIVKQLQQIGFSVARYSETKTIPHGTEIYLYDQLGQLEALIKHARLVFLGGSLVPKGGHNLLEAARLLTPQVTGAYLDNVAEEADNLRRHNALLIVEKSGELSDIFSNIAKDKTVYSELASNAAHYLEKHAGIAIRYIKAIEACE